MRRRNVLTGRVPRSGIIPKGGNGFWFLGDDFVDNIENLAAIMASAELGWDSAPRVKEEMCVVIL